jgi:hypothetical protein
MDCARPPCRCKYGIWASMFGARFIAADRSNLDTYTFTVH